MIDKRFVETKLSNVQAYFKELGNTLAYSDQEIKKHIFEFLTS
jgi:hypothetical protein